ncbi:plasmid mobilization relaxosome protein MobC [Mucilaginibacter sp. HME9299]|uniref:Plasmid mobilization relaxosome protein MobC n=1 Tax=Mucilaginibacter aquatilis TaxID=1517760 RepID=A0A6I4IGA4_9SPHI|nr:plasmid mobilization relaxosome protein MobC [Mucilaginibacter aquatilis]
MGRPPKSEEDKRTVQVNIRLTEEENRQLNEQAEGSGLSPANWIRHKVFTGRFPAIKVSPIEGKLYRELHYIGNNLNQAVKQLHTGRLDVRYEGILNSLLRLKYEILSKLLK